jgi:hypothetical protein
MINAAKGIAKWHKVIEGGSDPKTLSEILRHDAVFHSPVVHTPQVGKPIVMAYLTAAGATLGNDSFTYLREVVDGDTAVLEFSTEMDGIHINGIDMITFDDEGKIIDFKVMVRPLKAINKVWEMMGQQLEKQKGG